MLIEVGEKAHIITRRLYHDDLTRHFVGEIVSVSGSEARLEGYTFVFDKVRNEYHRRPERRTRIFNLSDGAHIVNIIPRDVVLENVQYVFTKERGLVVTDGAAFSLDIHEFGTLA